MVFGQRKRKASSNPDTPAKKVRIGSTTDIPDLPTTSPTSRPKRASVGHPTYSHTRRGGSSSTQKPSPIAADSQAAPKKRGRPPKVAAPPVVGRGRPRKHVVTTPPAEVKSTRPRGRPRKSPAADPAATSTKSPSQKPLVKRGRKPKASVDVTTPEDASDSEDPLENIGEAAVSNGRNKLEDLSGLDADVQYWLMKAEPESRIEKGQDVKFSIDDLAARTEPEAWDGVRNAVARNNMRAMRKGDLAFFYHSNCTVPGVVGVMRVVAEHSVDDTAFDLDHPYFDAKSDPSKPKWDVVHVEFVKKFENMVSLREMRTFSKPGDSLESMQTLKQSRLSISYVSPKEWRFILDLAGESISLGHGDGMGGYESEVDGEGEETVGISDADGANESSSDGIGLSDTGNSGMEKPITTEQVPQVGPNLVDGGGNL